MVGEHCELFEKSLKDTTRSVLRRSKERSSAGKAVVETEKQAALEAAAKAPRQLFLAGMEPARRALQSDLAASSLYVPRHNRSGDRPMLDTSVLVSQSNVEITYTGAQLDEDDVDVVMALMLEHQLRGVLVGDWLTITTRDLLARIGRERQEGSQTANGHDYHTLKESMNYLYSAALRIETFAPGHAKNAKGKLHPSRIVKDYRHDKQTGVWHVQVDPQYAAMHAGNRYSLIDWNIRLAIPGDDQLTRALQRVVATTSDRIYRRKVSELQRLFARDKTRPRDFETALQRSADVLRNLGHVKPVEEAWIYTSTRERERVFAASRNRATRAHE